MTMREHEPSTHPEEIKGQQPSEGTQRRLARAAAGTGAMLGIGIMGAADEIIFHQLLQWHNLYVYASAPWRVFSDGLLHIFTALLLSAGGLRLWRQRGRLGRLDDSHPFWAGLAFGAGGFQLFDGIINHKVLQIHPVREGVALLLPYDIAWNLAGLLLLFAGWLIWRRRQPFGAQRP